MSLLRGPRPRGACRKGPRKPLPVKRDWDSTVHDLTVHRATPEDILRRHEIHKSKNKALAQLELQEKALKRKWKKQKAADSLEKRKLILMREILSDQYQLQDVLERTDQVIAVAKDLVGDAPRTRTGIPNVTMAPNCDLESSQGHIVQKCDTPAQLSILSESVMRSQALNEVEEEASSICQSEDGHCDSLRFKSSISSDRLLRLLREENSLVNSQLWAEKDMRKTALSQESNVPLTPTASPSWDQSALNGSSVVKRIHSRLHKEDEEETGDSTCSVRQVLNPKSRKQKQIAAKVKRKQTAQNSVRQRRDGSPGNSIPIDLQRDNKSSLDVLNHMIHEVEHELEEYERCTGRVVQKTGRSEGLTGFTLSLVNALCRLMRYLKESEMQLREKEAMRQQHEEMLNEHRELIDALTAEILLVREENNTMQKKLQQYMTVTDEQLMSLTRAFEGLPLVEPRREQSPNHFGVTGKGPANGQEKPGLSYSEPRTDAGNRENMLKLPQEELPFTCPPRPGTSGGVGSGRGLPAHVFQPAVLLSPPRQKSSQELSPLQNAFIVIPQSPENTDREPCKERSSPSFLRAQSTAENCLISQRQPVPPADRDLESSHEKSSVSSSCDTRKSSPAEELLPNSDLLGQIAELTQQNSLIKAQLSKFRGFSEDTSDYLHQLDPLQNADPSPASSQGQSHLMASKSLEERIAELNRQSTEARDKLLQLIEQQKLAAADTVPPMTSPVLPPSLKYPENSRTIEVSIPVAAGMDSSKEDSVSPASMVSIRRRQKKTASHTVMELENSKDCNQAGKPLLCPSHPTEELRLFCEQCDQAVCQHCVVGRHRQHPCDFTGNVIHRHGDALRELLKSTQQHMGTLESVLSQIDAMGSAVHSRAEAVATEICLFASGYVKAIEEHRDRLLKQLEDLKVQKVNLLHLQKAQLQQLLLDMRTGVGFTEHLLASGSDLEILITKGVVASRLAKLNRVAYNTHPSMDDGIQFSPQEKAGQCCGYEVFGAILNKAVDPARCTLHGEDLHNAHQNQLTGFTLLCNDTMGERMGRGGEAVRVTITHKDKRDCTVKPTVCDNGDGTYHVSYSAEEPGVYAVCVCVKGQHVQGSPFTVMVKGKFREHQGVFHCCTFCSSGGQKSARCACGGTMPGGYQGCGHGHKGHPGCPHWSCCGQVKKSSECSGGPPSDALQRGLLRTVAL